MKYFKLLKQISLVAVLALLMTSCGKDIDTKTIEEGEITPTTTTEQNSLLTRSTTSSTETGLSFDCFEVQYPFSLIDGEGVSHEVDSDEALLALMESDIEIFDFEYPVTITYEDGSTNEVNNGEELGEAFASCLPNGWTEDLFPAYLINQEISCFDLVYPLDLQDLEDNVIAVDSEEAFIEAIAGEPMFFVFPLTIVNEEGEITVENIDELLNALFTCNEYDIDTTWSGFDFEFIGCYEITFPFDVVLEDGSVVTVNDHMEYCDLLLLGEVVNFAYPLTLTNEEGEEIVVNSDEELNGALEGCWEYGGGYPEFLGDAAILIIGSQADSTGLACYTINFPISVNELDPISGEVTENIEVNNEEELFVLEGITEFYSLNYPISITLIDSEEVVELNSIEELLDLLATCLGG